MIRVMSNLQKISRYMYLTHHVVCQRPIPQKFYKLLVRAAGIEPALLYRNKILSLACLPIPPRPQRQRGWSAR